MAETLLIPIILLLVVFISPFRADAQTIAITGMILLSQQDAERTRLVSPRVAVPILNRTATRPVLGVIAGDFLYFSDAAFQGDCIGKDLYRLNLQSPLHEEKVLSVECVQGIQSDGEDVFVSSLSKDDKAATLDRLSGTELEGSVCDKYRCYLAGRTYFFHRMQSRNPDLFPVTPSSEHHFHIQPDKRFASLLTLDAKDPLKTAVFLSGPGDPLRATQLYPFQIPEGKTLSGDSTQMAWDSTGTFYFSLAAATPTGLGGLMIISNNKAQTCGIDVPYTDARIWDVLDRDGQNGWAIRRPGFLTGTRYGAVVADTTPYQTEWKSLSYVSPVLNQVFRIQIPVTASSDIGGISFINDGILVSHPESEMIVWYGQKNPFLEEIFPTRDVTLRPLSEEELLELRNGGKQ